MTAEEGSPTVRLLNVDFNDNSDNYYTVILANPDDFLKKAPIIHHMVTNVSRYDLLYWNWYSGKNTSSEDLVNYVGPGPGITYSYLIYQQMDGVTDFSSLELT